jgi:hypothetical protein
MNKSNEEILDEMCFLDESGKPISGKNSQWVRWIRVEDRLPDLRKDNTSDDVLICDSCDEMYVARLNYYPIDRRRTEEKYTWTENSTGCGCCSCDIDVTHWIPLPEPPKK